MKTTQDYVKELMAYKGEDPIMQGMKKVLQARHRECGGLFFELYTGADGDVWRIWTMQFPHDPRGHIVWQQLMSTGGNDSKDMVESPAHVGGSSKDKIPDPKPGDGGLNPSPPSDSASTTCGSA